MHRLARRVASSHCSRSWGSSAFPAAAPARQMALISSCLADGGASGQVFLNQTSFPRLDMYVVMSEKSPQMTNPQRLSVLGRGSWGNWSPGGWSVYRVAVVLAVVVDRGVAERWADHRERFGRIVPHIPDMAQQLFEVRGVGQADARF